MLGKNVCIYSTCTRCDISIGTLVWKGSQILSNLSKYYTKGLGLELDKRALTYFTILQREPDPDLMKGASEEVLD